jgi:hypothetical protein
MGTPNFGLEVSFNGTTGQPVAAYIRVREGKVVETREVSEGVAFADYGADDVLLGDQLNISCPGQPEGFFFRFASSREIA